VEGHFYATWLFYAALSSLCLQVAVALGGPMEKISAEVFFRSLYHLSRARAIDMDEGPELILFWFKTPNSSAWPKPSANVTRRMILLEIWGDL